MHVTSLTPVSSTSFFLDILLIFVIVYLQGLHERLHSCRSRVGALLQKQERTSFGTVDHDSHHNPEGVCGNLVPGKIRNVNT